MAQGSKFKSMQDIGNWFGKQTSSASDQLCVRATIRCLPVLALKDPDTMPETELFCLWATLRSACSAYMPNRKIRQELPQKWLGANDDRAMLFAHSHLVTRTCIQSVITSYQSSKNVGGHGNLIQDSIISAGYANNDGREIFISDKTAAYIQFQEDVQLFKAGQDLRHLPTWEAGKEPVKLASLKKQFCKILMASSHSQFWFRFFNGMSEGTFTEWDLAFEVIKIDEADWEKGYEHIGEIIAAIEARLKAAASNPTPTKAQSDAFAQRATENTQAIALTAASLLE